MYAVLSDENYSKLADAIAALEPRESDTVTRDQIIECLANFRVIPQSVAAAVVAELEAA
jgi:hypothetical protein